MEETVIKKKRIHINLGTIVFLAIVFYLTASVIRDLGREKLAVYEVEESVIDDEIKSSGVIIRNESLIKTKKEGFINYYLRDGARVKKGGLIYNLDPDGKITSYLNKLAKEKNSFSTEEKNQVINDLRGLSESFTLENFSQIYGIRNTINYDLMAYSDTIISENMSKIRKKFGKKSYKNVTSPKAGLVSYYSDGLEGLKSSDIEPAVFSGRQKMSDLRIREKAKEGTAVCRLVKSQKWKLVLSVSEDEFNRLSELKKRDTSTVRLTFLKDNFTCRVPFSCKKKKDGYYAVLSFEDYVQRYMNERYLSVRLLLSETKGLKIPSSSLLEKKVYRIPARFLTRGSDSDNSSQVNVLTVSKKGEKVLHQQTVTVYQREGAYVSIGTDGFRQGDIIASLDKTDRFPLLETARIQGVYMVNRGYAAFKAVSVIRRNEDYCIVSPEESSIELYDRIILNSNTIKENDVIY